MELKIKITKHPNKTAEKEFNQLMGIDKEKSKLLSSLTHLLDDKLTKEWIKTHHNNNLPVFEHINSSTPLVVLEGDVGCGKTALAQSIGTILSTSINKKVTVFETPSNIRGGGLVGEISNRITEAFDQTKRNLKKDELGILIIDEADDIATSREQNQAHHEDRAGLNVLIKQLDLIKRDDKKLAVILITNRVGVLDPAVRRRCSLQLRFNRPTGSSLKDVLTYILSDIASSEKEIDELVKYLAKSEVLYSFSDLIHRVAKEAIHTSIENDVPFTIQSFKSALEKIEPSPQMS